MSATLDSTLMRSGVTIIAATPLDRAVFTDVVRRDAERQGAEFREGDDGPMIAMIGFHLGDEMSAVALSEVSRDVLEARPDLELLLGQPAQTIVRIEMTIQAEDRVAPLRADAEVAALIVNLAVRIPLIACDDIGAVYDIDELRSLVGRGVGRMESSAFVIEAARRAEQIAELSEDVPPAATGSCSYVLPLVGPRVPALAWVEAIGGDHVGIIAPDLDFADQRALARAGIPYSLTFDGLATETGAEIDARRRDEVDLFAGRRLTREEAVDLLEDVALSFAQNVADTDAGDAPLVAKISAHENEPGAVAKIATFGFRASVVNVYHLDLPDANAGLAEALGSRRDIAALVGGSIRTILAVELVADDDDAGTLDLRRADVFSVAIAAAFAGRHETIAADLGGATYGRDAMARLAAERRGRDGSWNAQVAAAASVV